MSQRWLAGVLVAFAVLSGCGSLDNRVTATCNDEVGDVREAYAWTDVESATVTADDDTIEAVVRFAKPLPENAHGEIRFVVGILQPPDEDHSVLGEARGTTWIVADVNHGSWRFGVVDGRRDDTALAAIGQGKVGTRTVRMTMPTSRIGRTGRGSGWNMVVQPYGEDFGMGDECPGGLDGPPGSVDF